MLELYFEIATAFQGIAELYDEHFTTLTETGEGDVIRTLFCLDPSAIIAGRLKLAKASVLFSATLTPLPYYRELLGGDETDPLLSLPSPFEEERLLLVAPWRHFHQIQGSRRQLCPHRGGHRCGYRPENGQLSDLLPFL